MCASGDILTLHISHFQTAAAPRAAPIFK